MADTTPYQRHPTGDLNVVEFLRQEIHDISRKVSKGEEQNTQILVSLARLEGKLDNGTHRFDGHDTRLDTLEKKGDKSMWALLAAAIAIIGHLINYIIHGGKS